DFGSSAMLVETSAGRELLVAGQKSGVVYALDPNQKGKVIWQTRIGQGSANGGVQWGMASDGQKVYAAVSDAVRLGNVAGPAPLRRCRAWFSRDPSTATFVHLQPKMARSSGTSIASAPIPPSTESRPTAVPSTAPAPSSSMAWFSSTPAIRGSAECLEMSCSP